MDFKIKGFGAIGQPTYLATADELLVLKTNVINVATLMSNSKFSEALSKGNLHTALRILQIEGQLDESLTPTALAPHLEAERTSLHNARTKYLEQIVPLKLLPSAVASSETQIQEAIRQLVAAITAENVPLAPGSTPLGTAIPHDPELFDEASAQLAICGAAACDELVDAWNQILPAETAVESGAELADAVRQLLAAERELVEEVNMLDYFIAETQRETKNALYESVRGALQATEMDTEERVGDFSADDVAVDVLVARGAATKGKLKLQRAEIAARMYTPESVKAIRCISEAVDGRLVEVKDEVVVLERKLEQYRQLGREFENCVAEFNRCEGELERKIWSRSELLNSGSGTNGRR